MVMLYYINQHFLKRKAIPINPRFLFNKELSIGCCCETFNTELLTFTYGNYYIWTKPGVIEVS